MPAGLDRLTQLLQDHCLVPVGSVWLLLLALFILQQLSEGNSEFWAEYVHMLPCPMVAAPLLCPSGPPTAHILFFR